MSDRTSSGEPPARNLGLAVTRAALLALGFALAGTPAHPSPRELTVHLAEDVVTLDWGQSAHEVDLPVVLNIQEGLTRLDQHLKPVPSLAESWKYDATGTQLKFKLRADARWSDGRLVTAHDFVAAWKRLLSPTNHFSTAYFLFAIRGAEDFARGKLRSFDDVGIRAPTDTDLEVTFQDPAWRWIQNTAVPALFPVREDIVESNPNWTAPGMVTDGPFRMTSHTFGSEYLLERRVPSGAVDQIRFRVASYSEAIKLFQLGKLDVIFRIPRQYEAVLKRAPAAVLKENGVNRTRKLDFNKSRYPVNDVNIRRALALAIDRVALLKAIPANDPPATTLIPPGFVGYRKHAGLGHDLRRAKISFSTSYQGTARLRIDLLIPYFDEAKEENQKLGEELKRQWEKALAVDVHLALATTIDQYLVLRNSGDYHLLLRDFNVETGDPLHFYSAYGTDSRFGMTWPDRKYDVLLQTASRARTDTELANAVAGLDDYLLEETVTVTPLFYRGDVTVLRANLRGYSQNSWQPYFLDSLRFAQ